MYRHHRTQNRRQIVRHQPVHQCISRQTREYRRREQTHPAERHGQKRDQGDRKINRSREVTCTHRAHPLPNPWDESFPSPPVLRILVIRFPFGEEFAKNFMMINVVPVGSLERERRPNRHAAPVKLVRHLREAGAHRFCLHQDEDQRGREKKERWRGHSKQE